MTDLAAWLLEQIATEERSPYISCQCGTIDFDGCHMRPGCPNRVRIECDAKRRLVGLHTPEENYWDCPSCTDRDYRMHLGAYPDPGYDWCQTLRLLAVPYAGRDGYRKEWHPDEEGGSASCSPSSRSARP